MPGEWPRPVIAAYNRHLLVHFFFWLSFPCHFIKLLDRDTDCSDWDANIPELYEGMGLTQFHYRAINSVSAEIPQGPTPRSYRRL